ncbi:MAG: glutaredoxin family protein [bacterium]|nr:glutaredoxin family protein [bacterium]
MAGAPPRGPRLTLYSRPDCHLCEVAKAQVREMFGAELPIEEIDVDSDPALAAAYGEEIPVGFIGVEKAFKIRVEPRRLRRLVRRARK